MTLTTIGALEARDLLARGARLFDIRSPDEHRRVRIEAAENLPVDRIESLDTHGTAIIFHCRSGARTDAYAERLAASAREGAYVLAGGLDGWRAAGLPVVEDRGQPIEVMRQVQIAAGTMVVVSVALGLLVAPALLGVAAFVGGGLVIAGITGWCGMARLLLTMPWNRRASV